MDVYYEEVDEDYFDLDTILATNSNITCILDKNTPLGFFPLVGQKGPNTISDKGYRAGVGAWILPKITDCCTISIPHAYNSINRDVIQAGAQAANFELLQRNFYSLGIHLCRLTNAEEACSIANALLMAFSQRIEWILQRSLNVSAKPNNMDEIEKRIFKIGQETEKSMRNWIRGVERQSIKRKHT